jgi:hypothetical protein
LDSRYLPPIDPLLDVMVAKITDGPSAVRPLHKLDLRLSFSRDVGAISQEDLLRILQLRAAGKTISITKCGKLSVDLVEHWRNIHGL